VQIDALAVRLRPRTALEAADLGVRLCQSAARSVFPCYLVAAVPLVAVAMASVEIARWLPGTIIWCAKPWLDRTILFVLSRAAFGQDTRPSDLWRAQGQVWWSQWFVTWTLRRLSPWRSLTQPVYQLEGLSLWTMAPRLQHIRRRTAGAAMVMTSVFAIAEMALTVAVLSLVFWFAPAQQAPDVFALLDGGAPLSLTMTIVSAYAITVLFLEPFYVAAGFGMYLNRRAELEAWDIEQEFRRAFAH
jgi:hypothetical protein